jgi:hypothetical protein
VLLPAPALAQTYLPDPSYRVHSGWGWGWFAIGVLVVLVVAALAVRSGRLPSRRERGG